MNIKQSAFYVAISTISIGLVSYLLPTIGARIISATDLAALLSIMAVINTLGLTFNSPLDLLLPKVLARANSLKENAALIKLLVSIFGFLFGLLSAFILLVYVQFSGHEAKDIFLALAVFTVVTATFNSLRSYLAASGNFKTLMQSAIIYAVFGTSCLFGALISKTYSSSVLISTLTLSSLFALLFGFKATKNKGAARVPKNLVSVVRNQIQDKKMKQSFLSILLMTLVTLIINNGIIIGAQERNIDSRLVVVVVALASLARIPFMLLNSVSPPILNASTHYEKMSNFSGLKSLYKKAMTLYLFTSITVFTSLFLISEFFIKIYLGRQYMFDTSIALQVLAAESLIALIGLPRLFLVALHSEFENLKITIMGLIIFLFFVFQEILGGIEDLSMGVILASVYIFSASNFKIYKKLRVKN